MALDHDVRLLLGSDGRACDVFNTYRAVIDLTQVGNEWTFELWRSDYARSAWDQLARGAHKVKAGDWVGLTIDSALVLLGQIDAVEPQATRGGGTKLVISGRDILAPAVDSSADPRTVLTDNTQVADAVDGLLAPLGVAVEIGVDQASARAAATGARRGVRGLRATVRRPRHRVDRTHPKPGETVWGLCDTLFRKCGLLVWCAPLGERVMGLVVGVPDYSQPPTFAFTLREDDGVAHANDNILSWSHRVCTQGVPYEVFVHTAAPSGDGPDGRYLAQRANGALLSDDFTAGWVSPQLPTIRRWLNNPRARTQHAAEQDADRALADANRKLRSLEIEVQGHSQETRDGFRLYGVDVTARVRIDAIDLDEVMLIERVEFTGSREGGALTKLRLHPLGAIQLTPDPSA
jgi:prophage tail gpP-like protein